MAHPWTRSFSLKSQMRRALSDSSIERNAISTLSRLYSVPTSWLKTSRLKSLRPHLRSPQSKHPPPSPPSPPPPLPPQRSRNRRSRSRLTDRWVFELLSALLGTSAVLTILTLLRVCDGKPMHRWGRLGATEITLNAILAFLGVVARSAFMVPVVECLGQGKWAWFRPRDRGGGEREMGRGRKGGRPLMDFERFDAASRGPWGCLRLIWLTRGGDLASIGAFITLLTFFIDPFIQLSVSYTKTDIIDEAGVADINFVHHWGDDLEPSSGTVSAQTISAILGASVTIENLAAGKFEAAPECPSGNCIWDPYPSLAICTSSRDVSSYLKLPREEAARNHDPLRIITLPISNGSLANQTSNAAFNSSLEYAHLRDPIVDAFVIITPDTSHEHVNGKLEYLSKAIEFEMHWCVQTYESTVSNGVTNTFLSEKQLQYSDFTHLRGPGQGENLVSQARGHYGQDFTVDVPSHRALQQFFTSFLRAENEVTQSDPEPNLKAIVPENLFLSKFLSRSIRKAVQPSQDRFSNNSTLDLLLENIASSIMARAQQASNKSVRGRSYKSQTVVRVHWVCHSVLVSFMGLSLLFLLATMIHQRSASVWKTSSLAALRVLSPHIQAQLRDFNCLSDMEAQAKTITVSLNSNKYGQVVME